MAFQFPWTNLHELNLDWFLSKFKQFTNNYLETTATAESVPYTDAPTVTVTGGDLDDDTDIVDPFTFNFKIPAGQPGAQGAPGAPGAPGQDGFSPIATVTKSGSVATITITDANGTTTTTISDGEVTQDQLDTKAPAIIPTASGLIASFSDGADDMPLSELKVGITAYQSGSGDPAPDNIRPLSGWTGCNVVRTGGNVISSAFELGSLSNTTGLPASSSTYKRTVDYISIKPNTKYYIKASAGVFIKCYDINYNAVYSNWDVGNAYNVEFTTRSNATYMKIVIPVSMPETDISVNYPSTDTSYHAYTGETITVSWQDEAGTVYGGTLDVKTGVLTVDTAIVTLSQFTGGVEGNGFRTNITLPNYNGVAYGDIKCNMFATAHSYAEATGTLKNSIGANYLGLLLLNAYVNGAYVTTLNDLNALIPAEGCIITYPLATTQTYQLTPQQLFNTLYGVNNVWSDTGDSTVTYTADTMLYIQNLTQPTENDMVANTAIANGKFFMIGNNLYRATTAIASGSQIIPGTNATPMSLADALNLL